METARLYDLLLIDIDGNVVFSVREESDLGSNLFMPRMRDTSLAPGFRQAPRYHERAVRRFDTYAPSADIPAAFVVAR